MGSTEGGAGVLEESSSGHHEEITGSNGLLPDLSTATTAYCRSSSITDEEQDEAGPEVDCSDQQRLDSNVELGPSSTVGSVRVSNGSWGGGDTSGFSGAMMIINAALGAGLLNFPSAFEEAGGIVAANGVQFTLLIFIFPALLILSYCADWNGAKSAQEVMLFVYGRKAERACSIINAIYCFGTCITFLIIMGDQFDRLFASLYGQYFCHEWFLNRTFTTISTSIFFILPFCYAKNMDFLKHISSIGVLAVIYVAILIIVQYYNGAYVPGEIKTQPTSWTDLFLVVPTLCFGYQCHVSTIPIYACYKKRNMKTFAWSSFAALLFCVIIYTLSATFGYLTFGSKVSSDILSDYDANDPYILVALIAISVKSISTYPTLSYCGCIAVCDLWVDHQAAQGVLQLDPRIAERFRLISITLWFTLTLVLAVFMPDIGSIIKLLGSLAAIIIFIFPGLCLLRMSESADGYTLRKPKKLLQLAACLYLVVGSFLFGVVVSQAFIYDFFSTPREIVAPLCLPLPHPRA